MDLWKKCVFIDEKIFETGPKGDIRVRRLPNTRYDDENVMKIQNSGWQSVMCVTCFSYMGVGPIVKSNGNFNSEQYVNYLEEYLIPYAENCFPDCDFYILHDNSRIHTSYQSLAYLTLRFGNDWVIHIRRIVPTVTQLKNYLEF